MPEIQLPQPDPWLQGDHEGSDAGGGGGDSGRHDGGRARQDRHARVRRHVRPEQHHGLRHLCVHCLRADEIYVCLELRTIK